MDSYENFNNKVKAVQLHEEFTEKIQIISEEGSAGRGRGFTSGGMVRDGFDKMVKSVSYDYLNMSHDIGMKEAKYSFRNYYALDLRINNKILIPAWERGKRTYTQIMDKVYDSYSLEMFMQGRLEDMYAIWQQSQEEEGNEQLGKVRKSINSKAGRELYDSVDYNGTFKSYVMLNEADGEEAQTGYLEDEPAGSDHDGPLTPDDEGFFQQDLSIILKNEIINEFYESLPTASEYKGNLVIKHRSQPNGPSEFVDLIMDGLTSANRGNQPQGITLSDIFSGKFGRKPIAADKGTFINRVKDESSDMSLDFRSWKQENLVGLHNIIMETFKRDDSLKQDRISDTPTNNLTKTGKPTRESIFLYITQEDFNKFADGGKGWSKLAKGALSLTQGDVVEL